MDGSGDGGRQGALKFKVTKKREISLEEFNEMKKRKPIYKAMKVPTADIGNVAADKDTTLLILSSQESDGVGEGRMALMEKRFAAMEKEIADFKSEAAMKADKSDAKLEEAGNEITNLKGEVETLQFFQGFFYNHNLHYWMQDETYSFMLPCVSDVFKHILPDVNDATTKVVKRTESLWKPNLGLPKHSRQDVSFRLFHTKYNRCEEDDTKKAWFQNCEEEILAESLQIFEVKGINAEIDAKFSLKDVSSVLKFYEGIASVRDEQCHPLIIWDNLLKFESAVDNRNDALMDMIPECHQSAVLRLLKWGVGRLKRAMQARLHREEIVEEKNDKD
eukprot:TRINITY_DN4461_c0_g1_i4.p1 TRINITY_DN4461_c0_g1~~TRINITY_DN4461_c0_g1_i4.p1  ORF type:complete len:333 (+),score=67.00 TRINITY_DN4461_c0_g1_i4:562-1560(+)